MTQPITPMVERGAVALFTHEGGTDWEAVCEELRQPWVDRARAVIEAMREPNEDMDHAGADAECIEEHWIGLTAASTCWSAMISAALGEKPE